MASSKKWSSERPEYCQICGGILIDFFVDGRIVFGKWAIMCTECARYYGTGLGTGCGQLYRMDNLEKVAG